MGRLVQDVDEEMTPEVRHAAVMVSCETMADFLERPQNTT